MRILIADDDLTSRSILSAVMKRAGYEVVEVVNGAEAWQVLQQENAPRLVILDWMMPEMDGLEVLRRVRSVETEQPPYIIMLTAKEERDDVIEGLEAGANDFLSKPFDAGELRARISVGRRMVELQEALLKNRETLLYQATYDELTGLMNRRAILERLKENIARAERHGECLAIGICDIDHFKKVNDTYGHQAGDDVLRELAALFNNNLRPYDSVGRMGGEEFLVVAPIMPGLEPNAIFDRLHDRVSQTKIKTRAGDLVVTLSIGVACASKGSAVDDLLDAADTAMYQAKEQGRNRVVYAPIRE